MIKAITLQQSIGGRDGDYIELANQWAKVRITYELEAIAAHTPVEIAYQPGYIVTGDTVSVRGAMDRNDRTFPTALEAFRCAFESLQAYQQGRAD